MHGAIEQAILREKRIKRWRRAWKVRLIEMANPDWDDLFDELRLHGIDLTPRPIPRLPK